MDLDPMALMVLSQQNQQKQQGPGDPPPQGSMNPGPDPEMLWKSATKLIHSGKFSKADVGAWLASKTNGDVPTFDALVQNRQQMQRAQAAQEQAQAGDPGALATGAGSALNGMSMGLLPKALGAVSPEARETFESGLKAGAKEHPWIAGLSDVAGSMASGGMVGGGIARGLGPMIRSPLARGLAVGAATGAVGGEAAGISDQPGQEVNPVKALPQAAAGTALGGILGGAGAKFIEALNPSEQTAFDLVRRSAPGKPGILAGKTWQAGFDQLQKVSDQYKDLGDPVLARPVGMLNRTMRQQLIKTGMNSQEAASEVIDKSKALLKAVTARSTEIGNDPETGYHAVLAKSNAAIMADPETQAIARTQGKQTMTGPELHDFKKQLSQSVRSMQKKYDMGDEVNTADMKSKGALLDRVQTVLQQQPGYAELNAKIAPYLQYARDLRQTGSVISKRMARGTQIGTSKNVETGPIKMVSDAVKGVLGVNPMMQKERAGTTLGHALMESSGPREFVEQTETTPAWTQPSGRLAGVGTGAAAPIYRKIRGLLSKKDEE